MLQVAYSKVAAKALARMNRTQSRVILARINELAMDPSTMRNVKKLKGVDALRLRVGDWRVVYRIDRQQSNVTIINIAMRGDVYRR